MSTTYNPEAEAMAEIERLELESRDIRKRIDQARADEDRRVLNRQLDELKQRIDLLKAKLP